MLDINSFLNPTSTFDIHSTEYHQEVQDLIANAGNAYINQFDVLYQNLLDNSAKQRYSKGGIYLIPFGYYHPTYIMDHYIQTVSRGRLLDARPEKDRCTYIYHYDSDDQVLAIESGPYFIKRPHEKLIMFVIAGNQRTLYLEYWKKPDEEKASLCLIAWVEKSDDKERMHIVDGAVFPDGMRGFSMWSEFLTRTAPDEAICESFKYNGRASVIYESYLLQYNAKGKVADVFMTDRQAYILQQKG